ncbi:bifunctional DNA primase/polymerase [Microcoleus sp. FACHB-53]|nr:bifunctional DNA primase/polymerase [Microcoleus sp. FACHB-53]
MNSPLCQEWKIFFRVPNAKALAAGLKDIPAHWSLTPLQDKSPRRDNWQTEPFIPHSTIADLILHGEQKLSKRGKKYRAYSSGFGLRTGEASGGLLALDVDGSSVQPLLDTISGGDIPLTPSWTSGKQGRYQLVFQIPDNIREQLKDFNRAVLTEWGDLQTARDENGKPTELLEFRYNKSQSCLPPSRHPSTGTYYWINNPINVPVAIAPQWLCELLLSLATQTKEKSEGKQKLDKERFEQRRVKDQNHRKTERRTTLVDFLESSVLPKLSPEQIYNWEGHNFQYLGKTLKGAPPWRASASGTSFHVWWDGEQWAWQDKALGDGGGAVQYRWKLGGGYGTPRGKDFADIVAELAADAGLQLPDRPHDTVHEPDSELYAEYVQEVEEEERVARAQYSFRQRELEDQQRELEDANQARTFKNWVSSQVQRQAKRLANWSKSLIGQGKNPKPVPAAANPARGGNYISSLADIRDPEVYRNEGAPLLLYPPGEMAAVWQRARFQGYKAVFDVSLMGTGKSEIAGRQNIENWFLRPDQGTDSKQRLAYFSQSGENTTAPSLEGWTPVTRMHNGLVKRPDKLTGGGNPFIERPKLGETPTIPGNCWATSLHHLLGGKNIGHGGSHALKDGDSNPICNLCSERDNCKSGSAGRQPSGFKGQMKQALKQTRLKGTLTGFPSEHNFEIVAFIDEAGATIQDTLDIEASLADVNKEFFRLWQYSKELYDAFSFIQGILSLYLSEEHQPHYGYDFASIKSWFAEHNLDSFEFEWALRKLEELTCSQIQQELRALKAHQTEDEFKELITLNWLIPFCQVMSGSRPGSVRVVNNRVIVTIKNDREVDLIRSFDFRVFLDATGDRHELAEKLGYEPWEILWVMQAPSRDVFSNLRVVQTTGLGKCGKDRRNLAQKRIDAVETAIEDWLLDDAHNPTLEAVIGKRKEIFPNGVDPEKIAYLRHLRYRNAGELYYFGGSNGERGSNAAADCQALIMEGFPRENIGSALARYHTLYKSDVSADNADFQAWYNRQTTDKVFQGIGRNRFTRRKEITIPTFIIGDGDLSDLTSRYGLTIEQIDAFQICPEAGTSTQLNGWKILKAIEELRNEVSKVLQRQVSDLTHLGQSTISEFAQLVGGWKPLIKISEVLFRGIYNTSDISELPELTEKERSILDEYMPLFLFLDIPPEEVGHELRDIISVSGLDSFLRIVGAAPLRIQIRMLAIMMQGLPLASINDLIALMEGIP